MKHDPLEKILIEFLCREGAHNWEWKKRPADENVGEPGFMQNREVCRWCDAVREMPSI